MTKRTTADWAALLNDTTPGPWETETRPRLRYANGETWEEVGDILICSDAELGPLFGLPEQTVEEEEQGPNNMANARLAAAAPEAVAEVVRLRRELARLAEFIDGYPLQQVLVASPTNGQRALDMQAKAVAIITRILEGHADD